MILLENLRNGALIKGFYLLAFCILSALVPACSSPSSAHLLPSPYVGVEKPLPTQPDPTPRGAAPQPVPWAPHTRAPVPGRLGEGADGSTGLPCTVDGALQEAARLVLVDPGLSRGEALTPSLVRWATRAAGSPYVRPQAARFLASDVRAVDDALKRFAERLAPSSTRRCGLTRTLDDQGLHRLAVVVADAPAALTALPTRVKRGQDIGFHAELAEPATRTELTLLGPDGRARSTLIDTAGASVDTRFALYERGKHVVQLLADLPGGPEPVLEAWIFVDSAPARANEEQVPGESDAAPHRTPRAQLVAMVNAARLGHGLRPLRLDRRLASLAQQHAVAMRASGSLAHDLGDGGPVRRVETAGLGARSVGENLARASNPVGAHRAIWDSPAHRSNLLAIHYDAIGIGLVTDERGVIWVCELFADFH